MGWFDGITSIFTGEGLGSTILRTVTMGYLLNKVSSSATKGNEAKNTGTTGPGAPGIDNGVRLQVPPAADQKIPVLYGSAVFGGIISEAVMSNNNQKMTYVLTLSEKTGSLLSNSAATSYSVSTIYWDDQTVYLKADGITVDYTVDRAGNRDASLQDLVKIYLYAGGSASANQFFPTGYSGTKVNAYSLVSGWNSAYQMSNLVFAVVEVNYSAERNIKGIGDVKFKMASSMNKPGDVIYDYMTNNVYGANIANVQIDTTSLGNLNTYSATSINYTDQTYGNISLANRYQINGLVNTEDQVLSVIENLASTAGSWLSYSILTGKWGVIINKSGTSVASFDDSNILGTVSVSGTGLVDLYNTTKAEFPNRDIRDATDYVSISIPSGDRNANEQDNTLNLTYNYLNEPIQAQLLSFIELKQSRIDLIIKFQADYTTINLNAGDIIDVTNSKLGFTSKLFRIVSISEIQGDEALMTEITALEYDATVYDETNLYRYTRTESNGLITAGNIGIPGTPTITKYETDARPRIEVSTTAPTGTVEGIEYWLSNDTALGDAQRNYRLIATKVPTNGNANVRGTYISGTTVTLDYDNIGTSNIVMKTRAYNSTTVGPFSANSAITTFTSTQATDAILPTTMAYNELGGLATALGVISLLNKLDGLFGNSSTVSGGVFDKIKQILFPDAPPGETNAESILTKSNTFQANIESTVNSAIQDPAFLSNVSKFTSNLSAYSINELADVDTVNYVPETGKSVLAWNGTNWVPATTCCPTLTFSANTGGGGGGGGNVTPTPTFLQRISTLPIDVSNTFGNEVTSPNVAYPAYIPPIVGDGEIAPTTGSYYAYFKGRTGTIYANLTVSNAAATARLYKSDGTLVETVPASSMIIDKNRLEIPFAPRETGTNYYILMDANVVTYCSDISPAITSPTVWNFNTPYYIVAPYTATAGNLDILTPPGALANTALTISSISWADSMCPMSNLNITFSEAITNNSGIVTITDVANASVVATLAGTSATISGATMSFGPVAGIQYSTQYNVNVSVGIAKTIRGDNTTFACGVWANTASPQNYSATSNKTITTTNKLALINYSLVEQDLTGNVITSAPYGNVSIESPLTLTFNKAFSLVAADPLNISIYEKSGALHQTFNLNSAFNGTTDFTSEIISISGANIKLNPTKDYKTDTEYYCLISANIIKDACENYAGISSTSEITWKTVGWTAATVTPTRNATNTVVNDTGINLTFPQNITSGPGRLKIYNSANVLIANIASTNGNVTYS